MPEVLLVALCAMICACEDFTDNLTLLREISTKVLKSSPVKGSIRSKRKHCALYPAFRTEATHYFPWFWCVSPAFQGDTDARCWTFLIKQIEQLSGFWHHNSAGLEFAVVRHDFRKLKKVANGRHVPWVAEPQEPIADYLKRHNDNEMPNPFIWTAKAYPRQNHLNQLQSL